MLKNKPNLKSKNKFWNSLVEFTNEHNEIESTYVADYYYSVSLDKKHIIDVMFLTYKNIRIFLADNQNFNIDTFMASIVESICIKKLSVVSQLSFYYDISPEDLETVKELLAIYSTADFIKPTDLFEMFTQQLKSKANNQKSYLVSLSKSIENELKNINKFSKLLK